MSVTVGTMYTCLREKHTAQYSEGEGEMMASVAHGSCLHALSPGLMDSTSQPVKPDRHQEATVAV